MKTNANYTILVYKQCFNCVHNDLKSVGGTRDTRSLYCSECTNFNLFDGIPVKTPSKVPSHYNGWDYGDFAFKQNYDLFQFNIGKYIDRHKKKNGKEDLIKAKDYLDKYIELYYGKEL